MGRSPNGDGRVRKAASACGSLPMDSNTPVGWVPLPWPFFTRLDSLSKGPVFFLARAAETQYVGFPIHPAHLHADRALALKRVGRRGFPFHLDEVLMVLELLYPIAARSVGLSATR